MADTLSLQIVLSLKDQASSALAGVGQTLFAVGQIAVGFGAQSVQAAAQYQQSMNMVQALTGTTSQQMGYYDASLKQLAVDAGVAPNQLAQGLYQIISSGAQGKQAMQELTLATQDSKIGMTDEATVADSLTNILKAFSVGANGANVANGQMLETVTLGKATFSQYASTITKASTTAAQFHISLATMSAAWATMTANSVRAKQASTDFVQVVQSMYGKVGTMTKSFEKNGIAFNENAFNAANFRDKILMLNQALQAAQAKHVSITGVTLQAAQAVQVISQHIGDYNSDLSTLSNKQAMAQKTGQAWAITQQGFNQQLSRAQAAFQVLEISVGNALLPVLTRLVQQVTPIIMNFATWITKSGILTTAVNSLIAGIKGFFATVQNLVSFGIAVVSFFQKNQWAAAALGVAVGALGGVLALFAAASAARMVLSLGVMLANMLMTAATTVTTAATMGTAFTTLGGIIVSSMASSAAAILSTLGPFLLAGAVIAAVVIGIILVVRHWGEISTWLQGAWAAVVSWFHDALQKVGADIQPVIAWFEKWKVPILAVAGVITAFFLPALIRVGVQAGIQAAKVTGQFIASLVQTGTAAAMQGAKTAATFVASMARAGVAAVVNGAKVTGQFVASMVKSGIQAVIAGAKVTGQFIASVVKAGLAGWQAAGKLALFIGQLIATGARAVWAGIQVAAKFVASLVQAGIQAVITGAKFVASLIPAILSFVGTSLMAAATAIPAMIVGFIGWAGGALAAAAATIAATWPILLIIAAIALLVVGIIVLIKHWGAVTAFIRTAWAAVMSWLQGALHSIAAFFVAIWTGIIGFLRAAWNVIVSVAKIAAMVLLAVILGPIGLIVVLIVTHWTQVKAFLLTAWNEILGIAKTLWSDVVGVFTSAWSGISNALHSLWSNVWNFVTGWPGQMLQLGQKIIQFLANGILGAVGVVKNAVGSVWSAIKNFFPHSPPKEGPGTDLPNWGPRFVQQFAQGIESGLPQLKASLGLLMTPVAQSMGAPQSGTSAPASVATAAAGAGQGSGQVVINLNLSAPMIDRRTIKMIMTELANELRSNAILSSLSTGANH